MNLTKVKAIIEALVFASSVPVSLKELAEILQLHEHTVKQLIYDLIAEYKEGQRGIQIKEIAGGYQFVTNAECADYVEKLKKVPRPNPLSQAALETLAIIAYKQPITRAEIEALRGVRVESSLATLLERDLIQEAGRKDAPGRPILYTTTTRFLEYFGLNTLDALPKIEEWTDETLLDLVMNSD
ncbi:MAG TPA: SMC-Scp complex subunit ScpB [Bacillota bacterium]